MIAVVRFPGSNCDDDCVRAVKHVGGAAASIVWHEDPLPVGTRAVVLPGGFSYGDYLRCGAIARFSRVMGDVRAFAERGGPVVGICNGFQVLVEAGMLPGALLPNASLRFVCRPVALEVIQTDTPFTRGYAQGTRITLPVAHGDGRYFADPDTLRQLSEQRRVVLRYAPGNNPNGALDDIAGICNEGRNVFGLMPHPERACDPLLGSADGAPMIAALIAACTEGVLA
ncbi:MAG: phosphoribosylformylglycinamidine synthase subunit PurQ [Proteobacteria bacterium]|nr:phosphoribosylformylglycinamidine synthase subunit PurQ [Pseudomonadota bacterium]